MQSPEKIGRFLCAVAAAGLLWLGASEAQAQAVCEVDVARTGTEQVQVSLAAGPPSVFQLRFAVSPGCASVIQQGPLRVSFFVAIFANAAAVSGNVTVAEQHFLDMQPPVEGHGPAAANGYSPRRSFWHFPAEEVQAAANSGGHLQIPIRLTTDRSNRGFRYFLTRTSADRHLNNADRRSTRSLTAGENIRIGTANRATIGVSSGRGAVRGFDRHTADPTSSNHPDTPGGGYYPRSDFYQFIGPPAEYPGTPVASAPDMVNEGAEIRLDSSGSSLPLIDAFDLAGLGASRPTYSMSWVQVTDDTGATEVRSGDANYVAITTENGATTIRASSHSLAATVRALIGIVTAPDVIRPTTLYFRLDLSSMQINRSANRQSVVVSVIVNDIERPAAEVTTTVTTVDEGTMTMLTGEASDPDSDPSLSYGWSSLTSGPTFDDPTSLTPTVTWPEIGTRRIEEFFIEFLVTDSQGLASDDLLTVMVRDTTPPTADTTGSPTSANADDTVTLDGRSSRRPGGHTDASGITITWIQTATASSNDALASSDPNYVVLTPGTGANLGTATFTAPRLDATLHFLLTVTDGETGAEATGRVAVLINYLPLTATPSVDAGADQTVDEGAMVTLSGTVTRGSGDTTSTLSYAWVQVVSETETTAVASGAPNYITLSNADMATATFTAPNVAAQEEYFFQLTGGAEVSGMSRLATAADIVKITVDDIQAPTANAGRDLSVAKNSSSALAGSGSDPDGDALTYSWAQDSPSSPVLSIADEATPTVSWPDVPTAGGTIVFTLTLTVTDGAGLTDTDAVQVTVRDNAAPTATISTMGATVAEGGMTTLSASGADSDGDTPLTYAWTVSPEISPSPFSDDTIAGPAVTWPAVTISDRSAVYTLTLTVTDSENLTGAASVMFTVQDRDGTPTAMAGTTAENNRVVSSSMVTLNGDDSTNAIGEADTELGYAWIQTASATSNSALSSGHAGYVALSDATAANPTFTAPSSATTLHFLLTVTDAVTTGTDTGRVEITVAPPRAVIVHQFANNLAEGAGFGFRAFRRSGDSQDVTGEIRVVATISATPAGDDNDVEPGDFVTTRGGSTAATSGVLRIRAGANSAAAYNLFYAHSDMLLEGTEAFRVTFSLAPGFNSGGVPVYVEGGTSTTMDFTLADRDSGAAAIVRHDGDGFSENGAGGVGTAIFRVTVNGAKLAADANVTFTVSGGNPPGVANNDYTVAPAADMNGVYTLTINPAPGSSADFADITLTQVNDSMTESLETITITITGISTDGMASVAASPGNTASAALVDDDGANTAVLSIARATDNDGFSEGASGSAGRTSFSVTLSAALPASVMANFSITGGSGVSADDYDITAPAMIAPTATGGSVTLVPGETTATITLSASSDTLLEGAETLTVTLGPPTSGAGVAVTLHATAVSATAEIGDSNSLNISLTGPGRNLAETAVQGNSNHQGVFTVAITGADLVDAASIAFSVTGCGMGASADCSFSPASPLAIPAAGDGSQQATITITATPDTLNEASETITVSLDSGSAGSLTLDVSAVADATTAIDDDDPVLVTVARAAGESGDEPEDGSLGFTVTLSGGERAAGVRTQMNFAVFGRDRRGLQPEEFAITTPATQTQELLIGGIRYTISTVSIPHDETTADIELNLIGDELNEAHEPLVISGSGGSGLRLSGSGAGDVQYTQDGRRVTVIILDDDDITLSLVPAQGTDTDPDTEGIQVREGSTVVLRATMDHATVQGAGFTFAAAIAQQANLEGQAANSGTMGRGTAADADFYPQGEHAIFPERITQANAGETTADIRIEIKADRLAEGDETLTVSLTSEEFLSSPTRGPTRRGEDSVDLIIVANSAAAHVLSLAGPASLDEGDAARTYTITRSGPAIPDGMQLDVTWGFSNSSGENAVVAADFTGGLPAGGTLSFSGSEASKTFTIDPAQDALAEGGADGEENFTLTLAKAVTQSTETALGGVQVDTPSFAVSLGDASDLLTVAIHSRSAAALSEDDGTVTWRISVTGATSTAAVVVPFTIENTGSHTALTAADYDITAPGSIATSANNGEITINAGDGGTASMCSTCGTITVTARSDTLLEGPEDLTLVLGAPTGGGGLLALSAAVTTPGSEAPAGGAMPATITDTDQLTATLSGGGAVAEGGSAEVTVALSGALHTADVVVAYTVGADADGATADASASDYSFTAGNRITIAPGSSSGVIRIAVSQDNLNEAEETFVVSVSNSQVTSAGTAVAAASPRSFSITDDDPITYGIALSGGQSATVEEGGSANFTITLRGGRLPANASVTASVSGAVDHGDYDITAPGGIGATAQSAAVMLAAQSSPTSGAATVSGAFGLSITADNLNEAAETLTVRIAAPDFPGSGVLTAGNTSAMLSIRQSNPLSITVARSSPAGTGGVDEGQVAVFSVSLSRLSGGAVSVPWTAQMQAQMHRAGQAANSASQPDLTASGLTPSVAGGRTMLTGTLQIAAGRMSGMVSITANADGLDELAERFTFTLGAPTGDAQSGAVSLGSPAQVAVEINPAAHIVTAVGPDAAVSEGGHAEFTLRLPASPTSPRNAPLTVAWTLSGGAPGADYAAADASGSATFAVSETTRTVRIAILDDGLNEGAETLTLSLGAVTDANTFPGGATALGPPATATIRASNPAVYSIGNASAAEPAPNAAGSLRIPVRLSAASAAEVTIPYEIASGSTATAGEDYTAPAALQVTIAAGQTTGNIEIALLPDPVHEADETLLITLGATPTVGSGGGEVSRSTADGAAAGTGTIPGNDPVEVELSLVNAAQTSVSEGASAALRLSLNIGGAAGTSQGDIFAAFTTEVMQQNAAAGAPANTGSNADIALPANDCGDGAAVAVPVMATGSATGCVRIPAGSSSLDFRIETLYDGLDENGAGNTIPAERVTLRTTGFMSSLGASAAAVRPVSGRQSQSFGIENVDSRRQLSVRASATRLAEEEGAQVSFSLAMTGAEAAAGFDVAWEITGASTAGAADTSGARSGTVRIPAGHSAGSAALPITTLGIVNDALNEGAETLILRLSEAPGHSLTTAGGRPDDFAGPATTISVASVTATIGASDPIAVRLARRAADTGRLVRGEAANYVAALGAAASTPLALSITATLGSSALVLPQVPVAANSAQAAFAILPCDAAATPPLTTGCIDAASAAASGEVQLAVAVSGVTGAPPGATAAPHATQAAAANIGVVGWELSISPTGSATERVQVGEGGALAVTISLRGAPAPAALMLPWSVTGGISAPGQTCSATGVAVAADFAGNAFPSGTLDLSGATTGTIEVLTAMDDVPESATGPDCFTLSLGALTGAQAGAVVVEGASAAYAEIADALRTLAAAVQSATVDEDSVTGAGETANVMFTITMRGTENPTSAVDVPWTLSSPDNSLTLPGGGASGVGANNLATRDLGAGQQVSGTVTFPAGADVSGAGARITVPVAIAQDALNEGPERLQLMIRDVPQNAGGQTGNIPGTLVSTETAEATVAASDALTVFLTPDPEQGTLTAGESARYTLSFGTTRVNGQVVPIVPTTEVRIPLAVRVGGAAVTLPPAAAAGGNAAIEAGNTVVAPAGAAQVRVSIPHTAIAAQSRSGTPTLTVAAQTPTGTPAGAEARPATAQDAAAESQRESERQGRPVVVSAAPPPAQVAGWEITIAQPDGSQAPEGAGYRVTFRIEGDTDVLSQGGVEIPWTVAARAATGGREARAEDFAPSRSTPPAYNCGQSTSAPGACASFPSGSVRFARGAAPLTTLTVEIFDDGSEEGATPEGFTLTLNSLTGPDAAQTQIAAGGVQLGALQAEIPALRVDLRLANATAPEGADAVFVLTLSNFTGGARTTRPITVVYALASGPQPGGALPGEDFTPPATPPGITCPAEQICALIPAGAEEGAAHRIAVPLLQDGALEPRETFALTISAASGGGGTVRLLNAAGEVQRPISAEGVITDDADQGARRRQRVSALVTVLDRQSALLATDAISARISRPRAPGAQSAPSLSIASRNLLGTSGGGANAPGAAGAANARAANLGLALYGASGRGGAAAGLPGAPPGRGAGGALSGGGGAPGAAAASAFGGLGAGLAGGANLGHRTALPSLAQLLNGSRFRAASDLLADLANFADGLEVWGSGGYANLRSTPQAGSLNYNGESLAFFIGADAHVPALPNLLTGLAIGWSAGDLNFTDSTGGFTMRGKLSNDALSLHPYLGWQISPHANAWLVLGIGTGGVDIEEREGSGAGRVSRKLSGGDSQMFMFSTGLSGTQQIGETGDLKLRFALTRVQSRVDSGRFDDGALLQKARGRSLRLGGEAEAGRRIALANGLSLRPFGTLRLRFDNANEDSGLENAALDWGAGITAAWANWGLDGRFAFRRQLNDTGDEEQGLSLDMNFAPGASGQGLAIALQTALQQRRTGLANLNASAGMQQSLSGEIGYGVPLRYFARSAPGHALLTPYARFNLGNANTRYAAGLRLAETGRSLQLGLEAGLDLNPAAEPRSYDLLLTGSLHF